MMGMTSSHIRYHDGHDIITYPISWHDITYPIITYPISWHDITYPISWHDITYPISWHDITYDIMISYIYRRYHHIAANISCQDKLPQSPRHQKIPDTMQQNKATEIDRQIVQPKGGSKMSFQVKTDLNSKDI